MEIRSGKPYANTIMTYRGSAGGLNQGKGYTEGVDDTKDVSGSTHYSFFVTCDGKKYFGEFNFALGLRQIAHLLGLAKDTPVKTSTEQAGAFNNGLTADMCFKDPIMFYAESAWTEGGTTEFHTLKFRFNDFVKAYEATPENIASVNVQEYMGVSDDRPSAMNKLLSKICTRIPNEQVRTEFQKIINHDSLLNSMFRLYELPNTTHISGDVYRAFLPNLQMYYYRACQQGFQIIHTQDDKPTDNTFIINKDSVIDPLVDRKKFPVMCWRAIMRKSHLRGHNGTFICQISWWNESDPDTIETVYIYPSSDGRKKRPDTSDKPPSFWAASTPYITLEGEQNILNEGASKEQFDALNRIKKGLNVLAPNGTDIQSVNDLRGIMLEWVYRLIGKPYWPAKRSKDEYGYGDVRNAQYPRCVVRVKGDDPDPKQQKSDCIEALKIPSNKHGNGIDGCDKYIKIIFAMMYGTLVQSYSCAGNGKNKNGRMVPWDLKDFKREMMKQWYDVPIPSQPQPELQPELQPQPLPSPPKPIVVPPPQTKITFSNDTERREVDIVIDNTVQHSIRYLGTFHVTRDWLKETHMIMGDQRFLEFAERLEELVDEFAN